MSVSPVIREHNKAHRRRDLVGVSACPSLIATSSASSPVKESQTNPMATYRMLWPKITQNGSKTRHHDQWAFGQNIHSERL
jgi:hypothetical protein